MRGKALGHRETVESLKERYLAQIPPQDVQVIAVVEAFVGHLAAFEGVDKIGARHASAPSR
jgi:hypothetical protein